MCVYIYVRQIKKALQGCAWQDWEMPVTRMSQRGGMGNSMKHQQGGGKSERRRPERTGIWASSQIKESALNLC